jgi:predicted transposase YdaD
MASRPRPDLDSPWKEALEIFLPDFLAFFFPNIHEAIDWSRAYQSLDKELHQIIRGARVGRRLADKLFKVWRQDGEEAWLLIHIEVQGQREEEFAERMFVYSYRIYDRYRRPVVSLAVLCDPDPGWRPDHFGYNIWGCEASLRFPVVKLLDYGSLEQRLEADKNPFAAVVLAHLKAIATEGDPEQRRTWKVRLVKGLYERGLQAEQIRQLFRLIDWMLTLPDDLEEGFLEELYRFEEERHMPYVTSIERLLLKKVRQEGIQEGRQEGIQEGIQEGLQEGIQKGLRKGLVEGIAVALDTKFGTVDKELLQAIEALQNISQIRKVARALKKAKTVDDIQRLLH